MNNHPTKTVLLGVTGSIAAYKSCELVRLLKKADYDVHVLLTASAAELVGPKTFEALSNNPVFTDDKSIGHGSMPHIGLTRQADLFVIAPATAATLAKFAHGHANDLLSTAYLACPKPILVAPAMNVVMWNAPATGRNILQLKADGVKFAPVDDGSQACGEVGEGRMCEPQTLLELIESEFSQRGHSGAPPTSTPTALPLYGKRVVVNAGPTYEAIDPVRFIGNKSSGKMGVAIALSAKQLGAEVELLLGPVDSAIAAQTENCGLSVRRVRTAEEMKNATCAAIEEKPTDLFVATAAVADYRPQTVAPEKLKKGDLEMQSQWQLELTENEDIVKSVVARRTTYGSAPKVLAFSAESENVIENAKKKLQNKGVDWIAANLISGPDSAFDNDFNSIELISSTGSYKIERMPKIDAARVILERISTQL